MTNTPDSTEAQALTLAAPSTTPVQHLSSQSRSVHDTCQQISRSLENSLESINQMSKSFAALRDQFDAMSERIGQSFDRIDHSFDRIDRNLDEMIALIHERGSPCVR